MIVSKRHNNTFNLIEQIDMKKPYMLYDDKNGDVFQEFFETQEECEEKARTNWEKYLTTADKRIRNDFYTARVTDIDQNDIPICWDIITRYK